MDQLAIEKVRKYHNASMICSPIATVFLFTGVMTIPIVWISVVMFSMSALCFILAIALGLRGDHIAKLLNKGS